MAKRVFDVLVATSLLIVFFPILVVVSLLIKAEGGPILFIQKRLGKDLSRFSMWKFRTMVPGAEHMPEGLFSYEGDTRITRVGAFLRKTSLDELPQLFNVLEGSMSIVGPRPAVVDELGPESDFDDTTHKRFSVKPGLTGLAQVSGRNDLDWPEKIRFDNEYIDRYLKNGLMVDVTILCQTLGVVLSMRSTVEKER